jgi:tripartite-type tricarboxylate transporter receptor subunit TctC
MIMSRRGLLPLAAATLSAPILSQAALAQGGYPSRSVRIIVPFSPGGALDATSRKVAQRFSEQTGQQFFVENRTGAAGTIGMAEAARAAPDGLTLLAMDSTYATVPAVFRRLPWDYENGFAPIGDAAWMPSVLVVRNDSRFRDYQSLVEEARRDPEKVTYGSGGVGSTVHFTTEAFQQEVGIKLFHVPYRGAGEAMLAVLSRQVDMALAPTAATIEHVRNGQMRALALSGPRRSSFLPDVPTFGELGHPNFQPVYRAGLAAPKATPQPIVARLAEELQKALASQDMRDFLASSVAEPGGASPAEFAELIRQESLLWQRVAERAGMEKQ